MWRLAYRNFGTHQALVANQSVEAAPNMAGIRWYEIRDPNGTPVIYQQGTYAPGISDGVYRWMGSIAMDGSGNIGLGYSASSATTTFPSVWYTGRLAADPLGTMPQGEAAIINGTGSQTGSQRWGDYTSMNIDPVDDCTYWYVNQYVPTTSSVGWRLRIGAFKFSQCGASDFTLAAAPTTQAICAGSDAAYSVVVGSIQGYGDPVTLSASGHPAGSTVSFGTNPVVAPGSSSMTIGNTAAAAGSYNITVLGIAPTSTHTTTVGLELATNVPGSFNLLTPANNTVNQPLRPVFSWQPAAGAISYTIEIAADAAFNNVVDSATGLTNPSYTPGSDLNTSTIYYWRVRAGNGCGSGIFTAAFRFNTVADPGDCPLGYLPNSLYAEDFESGAPGWTHNSGAGTDTWTLSTGNPYAGATAYHADDSAAISDQRLVSPAILLPSGQDPITLQFWNYQHMETRPTGCFDGGILEVSNDGGTIWSQVPNAELLTDPYDGPISASFGSPLANLNAWCGNEPQPYTESLVDLSAFAGQTVQFRFRLGTDNSVSRPGWDIDQVSVRSCQLGVGVDLSPDQALGGNPGQAVTYSLSVTNTGSLSETFDLSVSGVWTATLSTPSVSLVPGETAAITVTVVVPPAALAGEDDFTSVDVQSQKVPQLGDHTSLYTSANTLVGIAMSPDEFATAEAGSIVTYTLYLTNTGNLTDTYTLSLSAAWVTSLDTYQVTLGPGESQPVSVLVTVPSGTFGQDVAEVTAESMFDPSISGSARFTTRVHVYELYLPFIRRP